MRLWSFLLKGEPTLPATQHSSRSIERLNELFVDDRGDVPEDRPWATFGLRAPPSTPPRDFRAQCSTRTRRSPYTGKILRAPVPFIVRMPWLSVPQKVILISMMCYTIICNSSNNRLEVSGKGDGVMRRSRQHRLRWWIWRHLRFPRPLEHDL